MALRRVKVTMPKAAHGGFLKKLPVAAFGSQGPVSNQNTGNLIYPIYKPNMMATPPLEDRTTLGPVNREDSNLEAEKGETAYIPDIQGLAAHFTIGGKRHSQGGTPLSLPDDSFIFSDTSKMKIRDPKMKAMFGKTTGKAITPADIAKQYDINEFRKTLADPTITDPIQIKTAEQMIANYNLKLGKLALTQEASKGFPQGIPAVALPYLAHVAVDPSQVLPLKAPNQGQPQQPQQPPTQGRYGMFMENGGQPAPFPYSFHGGEQDWANGGNALMQDGGQGDDRNATHSYDTGYWNRAASSNIFRRPWSGYTPDPRMTEAYNKLWPSNSNGVGDYFSNLLSIPQKEVNNLMTGYYERPGETIQRYHPSIGSGTKALLDVVLDPLVFPEIPYAGAKALAAGTGAVGAGVMTAAEFAGKYGKAGLDWAASKAPWLLKQVSKVPGRIVPALAHLSSDNTTTKPTTENLPSPGAYIPSTPTWYPGRNVYPDFSTHALQPREDQEAPSSFRPYAKGYIPSDTTIIKGKNPYLKYGGMLEYASGGNVQKFDDGTTATTNTDGTITIKDSKGQVLKTIPANSTPGKPASTQARTIPQGSVTNDPQTTDERNKRFDKSYDLVKSTFTDPNNKELRDELYNRWKQLPENKGRNDSEEDVVNTLVKAQKHIFDIQKSYPQDKLRSGTWDTGEKNTTYKNAAKKLGFDPMGEDDIKSFQSSYRVLQDLADDPKYASALSRFKLTPSGVSDETYGKNKSPISKVDGWFGNTTVGQGLIANDNKPQTLTARQDEEQKPLDTSYIPHGVRPSENAPWWLQDVVKTAGAASDFMGLKKRLPWAPIVNPYVPTPTFYDPSRELAENAETANMSTQGATAFGNPQQYAATASMIQGNAAKNAANVLGKYNNMNVGEANRFAGIQADVMNRTNEANAATATSLYDKTTAANDNFDNAKAMAKQNLRQSYIDAVTNRAKAQVLNTMYPNFQIDPPTGGDMSFYKGTPIRAQYNQTEYDKQAAYFKNVQSQDPSVKWKDLFGREKEVGQGDVENVPSGYPGHS